MVLNKIIIKNFLTVTIITALKDKVDYFFYYKFESNTLFKTVKYNISQPKAYRVF